MCYQRHRLSRYRRLQKVPDVSGCASWRRRKPHFIFPIRKPLIIASAVLIANHCGDQLLGHKHRTNVEEITEAGGAEVAMYQQGVDSKDRQV